MTVTVDHLYGFLAPLMSQERAFLGEQVKYFQCEIERARERMDYLDAAVTALSASFADEPPEDGLEN